MSGDLQRRWWFERREGDSGRERGREVEEKGLTSSCLVPTVKARMTSMTKTTSARDDVPSGQR